jgi:hypothetical protein
MTMRCCKQVTWSECDIPRGDGGRGKFVWVYCTLVSILRELLCSKVRVGEVLQAGERSGCDAGRGGQRWKGICC